MIGGPLIVCRACFVPHYENCPTCWGFGIHLSDVDSRPVPVRAALAHNVFDGTFAAPSNWTVCTTCGSDYRGAPAKR